MKKIEALMQCHDCKFEWYDEPKVFNCAHCNSRWIAYKGLPDWRDDEKDKAPHEQGLQLS